MGARILQPKGWKRPKGYANGVAASGRHVFTAGVVGWNEREDFEGKDFADQFRQVLLNTRAILAEGDAAPADIVRMTCYVTDKREYLASRKQLGGAWKEIFGDVYPCMAVVEVAALMEDEAKVEIETTAIVAEILDSTIQSVIPGAARRRPGIQGQRTRRSPLGPGSPRSRKGGNSHAPAGMAKGRNKRETP